MAETIERAYLDRPFAVKNLAEDGMFEGLGSVFNVEDDYADIVAPGAFKRTLREHKKRGTMPAMLWQHKSDSPIGAYTAMREDDAGLQVIGKLTLGTRQGAEAYALLKDGAVDGLSIGYRTVKSEIDDKKHTRTLTDVDLWEVSLVTFPANAQARVSAVKSIKEIETINSLSDAERILRDAGYSRAEAVALVSRVKAIAQSESDARAATKQMVERMLRAANVLTPK